MTSRNLPNEKRKRNNDDISNRRKEILKHNKNIPGYNKIKPSKEIIEAMRPIAIKQGHQLIQTSIIPR